MPMMRAERRCSPVSPTVFTMSSTQIDGRRWMEMDGCCGLVAMAVSMLSVGGPMCSGGQGGGGYDDDDDVQKTDVQLSPAACF